MASATPASMNIDSLLDPISADSLCGDDLSFSPEFDAVREMRRGDDPSLAQGEWKKTLKVADWPGAVAQCGELLRSRTKDLRVAGWYADALARTTGFAGLADGLALCAGLCEDYWETMHPAIEDDGVEQRAGSLAWLLAQIPDLSELAPVLEGNGRRVTLRDMDGARALQQSIARGLADPATAQANGALTLDEVARIQSATPRAYLQARLADTERATTALLRLEQIVDSRLGAEGPGFTAARKALENAVASVSRLAQEAGPAPAAAPAATSPDAAMRSALHEPSSSTDLAPAGPLQTRAQALQQLRVVAEFFRRTEPHSPVAYLADKAAAWGDLPLHDWLRVVLKDPGALAHVEELLGVQAARSD